MTPAPIVQSEQPVTLVGGAPLRRGDLALALSLAPALVAADAGADAVLAHGHAPLAVIGDMDSLSPRARDAYADRLHWVPEQETTDFDKALSRIDSPLVLAVGFAGGRLDHELAALHGLVRHADRACLLLGGESLTFHAPPGLDLALAPGTTVSLFPFAPVRVASTGLAWPTDGLAFAPDARIGTSNESTGPVRLDPSGPGMLVILPRVTLRPAAAALRAAPRWPSPSRGG